MSAEIDALKQANREQRDPERDRRFLRLKHLQGIQMIDQEPAGVAYIDPSADPLLEDLVPPEIAPADLTPRLLRAAILNHGCLIVRGLVNREDALHLADGIETAFAARASLQAGRPAPEGYYEELAPEPPYRISERGWIKAAGGVLAVDSPKLFFDMLDIFERSGVQDLVRGYLGEPAGISAQKCTLRKAEPQIPGCWHQDGKFLGEVRALNLWLSLSRCGDVAPGLDIVPRRIDHVLEAGTDTSAIQVTQATVEEAAGDLGVLRPIFEPGDAIFFDEVFLHQTASDPEMPNPRYAIESWFFGPSSFPGEYVPLAA